MGGGIGMGNTCKPLAVSFQCMTKSTTNKKKNKKKKKKKESSRGAAVLEEGRAEVTGGLSGRSSSASAGLKWVPP